MSYINVTFALSGQKINIKARTDELFAEVAFRYIQKAGLDTNYEIKFFFNSKELNITSCKTLSEHKILDGGRIEVVQTYSKPNSITICMQDMTRKVIIPIQAELNDLLSVVTEKYIFLVEMAGQKKNKFHYFYNSAELKDLEKTLKEYGIGDQAIIEVDECDHEPYSESCNCIYRMKKEKNELNKRLNDEINKNEILSIENEK